MNPQFQETMQDSIQRTAFDMSRKYGRKLAMIECQINANEYYQKIVNLPNYDPEKIDAWDKQRHFWLSVKLSVYYMGA
jgi:hypothetical protein